MLIVNLVILFLLLALVWVFFEIKKVEKENLGLIHVLEKSEENRINSEKLKNKIMLVFDDLQEGFLVVDKDNKISVINRRAEKFLGINKKQILNKSILDLGQLSDVKKIVSPVLANFQSTHKEEIEVRENLVLELAIEPLFLDKNNVAKLVILQDVTKIKLVEKTKNQFISLVAHQLKTPLSTFRLSFKMLLDQDFGAINKQQKNVLEKIYKNNESLISLVEDLLKEAKVDQNSQNSNRLLVNLEDLVNPVVDFYKDEMGRKKIKFKFIKQKGKNLKNSLDVLADPEKIKIVIQNLLDNAVKYTPAGGRIEISITLTKGREVEFKIKDSGIGIPADQKEKIFKKFSRAGNATKTNGSGLGLSISKDIIEKHKGKIWFESSENKGSSFFFSLPCAKK